MRAVILTYDIYTRQDFLEGTITADKIGDRKGTYKVLETVTFNDDGTEAYSDQIGEGKTNILADGTQTGYEKGVIYAKNFLYNTNKTAVAIDGLKIPTGKDSATNLTTGSSNVLPAETFYWKMGTVQTSELAMRYYVYLTGSMEGTREGGSYPTNEYATLYYENYLHNPCYKDTVSPVMPWNLSGFFCLAESIIRDQLVAQLDVAGPAFSICLVSIFNGLILITVSSTVVGRIIDTDGIQIEVIGLIGIIMIKTRFVNGLNHCGILAIIQTIHLHDRNLPDCAITIGLLNPGHGFLEPFATFLGCNSTDFASAIAVISFVQNLRHNPIAITEGIHYMTLCLLISIVGINGKFLFRSFRKIGAGVDLHQNGTGGVVSHTDHIEAGAGKGEACLSCIVVVNGCLHCRAQRVGAHTLVHAVIAINVVGIRNGILTGTVFILGYTGNSCTLLYPDRSVSFLVNDPFAFPGFAAFLLLPGQIVEVNKAVLIVDGGCRDNSDGVVVVARIFITGVMNSIGELFVGIHLHAVGLFQFIANLTVVGICLGSTVSAGIACIEAGCQGFTSGCIFNTTGISTNTCQLAVITEHVVGQDGDIHRQTIVDDYGVGMSLQLPDNSKPDNCMGVIITFRRIVLFAGICGRVIKIVLGNIGGGSGHIALGNLPGAAAIRVDVHFVSCCTIIQGIVLRQDIISTCNNTCLNCFVTVQQNGMVNNRVGNRNLVCKGAGLAGGLVNDDIAVFIYQIEGIGNVGFLSGVVFIDGDNSVADDQIDDYISYGPNNEVYLAQNQSIAFILVKPVVNNKNIVANIHLGAKSANGAAVSYTIKNVAKADITDSVIKAGDSYGEKTFTVDTTTDMYYDIGSWSNDIIVITNTSESILSLTNIKSTYTQNPNGVSLTTTDEAPLVKTAAEEAGKEVDVYMTPNAAALALRSMNASAEDEIPDVSEPEESTPETTVPDETDPEDTTEPTEPEETTKPTTPNPGHRPQKPTQNVVKYLTNVLKNLFGGWFR